MSEDTESLTSETLEKQLFSYLSEILEVSMKKFRNPKLRHNLKLKWGRLALQGIQTWGNLRNGIEIEDMKRRLEILEAKK